MNVRLGKNITGELECRELMREEKLIEFCTEKDKIVEFFFFYARDIR